ncbi:GCN5-related N-acetyltransferase [Brachybacterium faecium]|uniref:Predicted acyltransferase n=1 Tax=Brachybacterium faecium (strain ATCC 43885 / DSM 4810 / JCM 11609 / LMG 19847 / NBRC 14762 / NCIMB 9860 / 6-10) TaxID=446465 RepID=C7M9P6_BRAFD|nr:GNAT family N-acetyltransferase [Brachybacterium faecium]ACU84590.1 predicted acyltransferase [Brachybacterium faecium DSM 4810]SLM96138.1 GCN5-related N-acetyltransferase [Brachybacterium faecium]HJG51513.1 GNAT family N-acetyltransferase [Brachybacterium faecium]
MAEIIRAHDDDWSLVREIRLRSLSTNPEAFGQSWDRESTYEDKVWKKRVREAAWFLAVEDGQPVAVVAVRHEQDSPANERELQAMWVTPKSRHSGIAGKLAEAVFDWAREDDADTITLYVGPQNTGARSLYESLGFTDTGDRWEVVEDDPDGAWLKMARGL